MHIRDEGSGPAVVLLHGQPGRGDDWDAVAERLRDDHRVLAPDRPGYGRSDLPPRGLAANADAVAAALDERGIESVTAAGHSWGGGVALALALRHPRKVHALVLAASIGTLASIDQVDRVLALPVIGSALAFTGLRWLPRLMTVRPVRSALTPMTGPMDVAELRDRTRHWRTSWRAFAVEQRAMIAEMPWLASRLHEVDVPAVVITGGNDRMMPRQAAKDLVDRLPNARLLRVPGAGHMLPFEAADLLAGEIRLLSPPA